jgi:hypothetical protein
LKHDGIGSGGQFVCSNEKYKYAAEKKPDKIEYFYYKSDFLMAHEEDIDYRQK